jgi:hypothetical protein
LPDVGDDQGDEAAVQHGAAPGLDEARHRLAARAAEQRGPLGIGLLEVARDLPAVDDEARTIAQRRNGPDLAALDRGDLGEAGRPRLMLQALVGERHARPPAMRREPPVIPPDQVVQHDRHCVSHSPMRFLLLRASHSDASPSTLDPRSAGAEAAAAHRLPSS